MGRSFLPGLMCAACMACGLSAADDAPRHSFELGAGGVVPLSGYRTDAYSPGWAWRPGYELRFSKLLGAETGLTQSFLSGSECNRFGCTHPGRTAKFLDYGLRAHAVLAHGQVDLSVGAGGGYGWFELGDYGINGHLFQYSGKASVALDQRKRTHVAFTLRTWRDLGRPTQQWLSATGGVIYSFGGRP
jgi:hypothetical protein